MCIDNLCYPGSKCISDYLRYGCICDNTRVGLLCEHENPCINNKCVHGKCNANLNGTFICECNSGFQGNICNEDINECLMNKDICGEFSCINTIGSYICEKKQTINCELNNCENNDTKQLKNNSCVCVDSKINLINLKN